MANRDTTITLLLRGNAAALNAALQQAGARVRSFANESQAGGRKVQASLVGLQSEIRGIAAGYLSLRSVQALARVADEAVTLQGRLKLATKSQEEFNTAYSGVQQIAQATRQPLAATVDLYARVERSTQSLRLSQDQLLGLTQTISQAVALSFTSAASGEAALMQLGQGLSTGRLGGEELNSVLEQTPRLAEALKAGLRDLGVEGADNLKKLASEGKLTTALVLRAIQSQGKSVSEEFAKLPLTIGGALTQLSNAFTITVGDTERATGAAGAFSTELSSLAIFVSSYNAALVTAGGTTDAAGEKLNVLVSIVRVLGTAIIGLKVGFQLVGRVIAALMISVENLARYLALNGRVVVAYVESVKKVAQFDFSGPSQFFQVQQQALGEAKGLARQTAEAWRAAGGDMMEDIAKANQQIELLWKTSADGKPARDFAANAKTIADSAGKVGDKKAKDKGESKKSKQDKERDEQERKDKARRQELADAVASAQNALLRIQGKEKEVRERELTAQYAPLIADMKRLGVAGESTLRMHIDTESAQAELQELQAKIEQIFGDQSRQEQSIQTRQQAGLLTEIGARRELLDLHGRTAAEVDQLLPKMDALAAKTGSPEAIERVRDLTAQVAALKTQSNELVVTLTNGFEAGLGNALEGLATGTSTLRQALTGLVQDMARSLAQLASQQLAALATAKLMSVVGRIVGGGKTPDIAQPDPVQAAAAGAAYATPITGASVALGVAGGVVLKAANAMQTAAATLLAANATKRASGFFASGGFTGIGPKYAPAGIVHRGEFVNRREVVRQPGARPFLERFNRIGMAALDGLRGYAGGGFVSPAPTAPALARRPVSERSAASAPESRSAQITNVLYLDPREIVNVMGTQTGRQVILSTIRANAPTVRQDLG